MSTETGQSGRADQGAKSLRRAAGGSAPELAAGRNSGSQGQGGKTEIADSVVAKIVGIAAKDVPGVYGMGSGMARAFGSLRERIPGAGSPSITQGVAVEVGDYQAAVDLDVIVEFGVSIPELAAAIRRSVVTEIERTCGLEATEVNIVVGDIHLPGDDVPDQTEPRVQ